MTEAPRKLTFVALYFTPMLPLSFLQTVATFLIAIGSSLFLWICWQGATLDERRSVRTLSVLFLLMFTARLCELIPTGRWASVWADIGVGGILLWRAWVLWPDRRRVSRALALFHQGNPGQIADAAGRYNALFSRAGLGMALRDADSGQVIECNPRYLEILGRKQQSLLRNGGREWTKVEFQVIENEHRRRLINREVDSYELTKQIILPDGSFRWVRVWATLANAGSKTLDVLADVDREIRAGQERDQSLLRLESLNRELEGFVLACAHDLKAPLRRIRQRMQSALSLEGFERDKKIQEAIAMADRLMAFIEQLLEYGRLDRDSDLTMMAVSISEIAQAVAYQYEGEAQFQIDLELPGVRCNPSQIERLFANLYGNAIKHGDGNPVITVTGHADDHFAIIRVTDNGPGIDEGLESSLFQSFIRGENSTGAGLGLAICQKIAIAHKGKITLVPSKQGAVFDLYLPLV